VNSEKAEFLGESLFKLNMQKNMHYLCICKYVF